MNTIVKTTPALNGFFNDVMNLGFDKFFRDDAATTFAGGTPVNITETNEAYHLDMIAPGRQKEDFQVELKDNVLTISFEKKTGTENEEHKTVRREFRIESFKRSFTINDKVDATRISASYTNGILKLVLPKKEDVKIVPAKIEVQ